MKWLAILLFVVSSLCMAQPEYQCTVDREVSFIPEYRLLLKPDGGANLVLVIDYDHNLNFSDANNSTMVLPIGPGNVLIDLKDRDKGIFDPRWYSFKQIEYRSHNDGSFDIKVTVQERAEPFAEHFYLYECFKLMSREENNASEENQKDSNPIVPQEQPKAIQE